MQEYTCFECGISSQFGDCHKMSCSSKTSCDSKTLMESYVNLLNNLHKFPVDMLNTLEFAIHVEIMEKGNVDIQKSVEEMRK